MKCNIIRDLLPLYLSLIHICRLYLAFRSPFTSIKAQKDFLLEV